jgi:hypothetical protein
MKLIWSGVQVCRAKSLITESNFILMMGQSDLPPYLPTSSRGR